MPSIAEAYPVPVEIDGFIMQGPALHKPADALADTADLKVPVIDLALGEDAAAEQVRDACIKHGFFKVKNHGVPEALRAAMMEANKRFFSLNAEQKSTILADENHRGYTPMSDEKLDPENQPGVGDSKEGLYFGRDVPKSDPEASQPLTGPNQWPSEELVPGFRAANEAYMAEVLALSHRLIRLLALSLHLPATHFDPFFERPFVALRPLHYGAVKSEPTKGIFGCGAHSDYGMLTVLTTDMNPGLQINLGGKWIPVNPDPECFIINLGDQLEMWTNGLFKSTVHRVIGNGNERYSAAYFVEPDFNALIECLESCCGPDNPPKFPPITSGEYLLNKYRQTHASFNG